MRHLDDYRCMLLCGIVKGSFKETAPRKTPENTVKLHSGGVGSMVANHRGCGEILVVITTLLRETVATVSFASLT